MSRRSPEDDDQRRRPVRVVALGIVVALLLLVGVTAWQAWSAYSSAGDANVAFTDVRTRLLDRDIEGAKEALGRAQESTSTAREALDGPQWSLATRLPELGDDIAAARELSATTDDVAQGALPAAMTALSFADPREIGLRGGRIELPPVRRASSQLSRAAALLRQADTDAAAIEASGLTAALRQRVVAVQEQLDGTSRLATRAAVAAELLPDMLGDGGQRNYLLMAQNTAEQRSLGGIPGALALLRAEDGRVELLRQSTATELGAFERPPLPLSAPERALYGRVLGQYPANVTDTPDFPRAAQLIKAMWEERIGGRIDGVASVDPWALQLLLQAVGPVETDAGRLTARNAAETLLVDVYADFADPAEQDEVFAQAAQQIFDRVREFNGDPRVLTQALADGVDQGRVMLWSSRADEQDVIGRLPLGRTLANPTRSPTVGVYLHDRTQSKMSTYQRVGVSVEPEGCGSTTSAQVQVRVGSVAPADRDLPESVTGNGSRVAQGDMLTQVVVYAPPDWTIAGVSSSDGREDLVTYRHDGLWAGTRDFLLEPGQVETLTVEMAGEAIPDDWKVRYTPGTRPANLTAEVSDCS